MVGRVSIESIVEGLGRAETTSERAAVERQRAIEEKVVAVWGNRNQVRKRSPQRSREGKREDKSNRSSGKNEPEGTHVTGQWGDFQKGYMIVTRPSNESPDRNRVKHEGEGKCNSNYLHTRRSILPACTKLN